MESDCHGNWFPIRPATLIHCRRVGSQRKTTHFISRRLCVALKQPDGWNSEIVIRFFARLGLKPKENCWLLFEFQFSFRVSVTIASILGHYFTVNVYIGISIFSGWFNAICPAGVDECQRIRVWWRLRLAPGAKEGDGCDRMRTRWRMTMPIVCTRSNTRYCFISLCKYVSFLIDARELRYGRWTACRVGEAGLPGKVKF